MRTPKEIVEPIYDGADYRPWRMLGMTCGNLEELIDSVQKETFQEGWRKGMEDSVDMRLKGIDPQRAIDSWRKPT